MEWFFELTGNRILMNGVLGWAIAQALKVLISLITEKRFSPERLLGDGGFPSSHSATVSAVAATAAFLYGLGSFEFAVTAILAIIVMHDASGVRLETGKQAAVINDILEFFQKKDMDLTDEEYLKELVGHTPIQVLAGALLGFLVALFIH